MIATRPLRIGPPGFPETRPRPLAHALAHALALVASLAALAAPAEAHPGDGGGLLVVYLEVLSASTREVKLTLGSARLIGEKDSLALGAAPRTLVAGKGPGYQVLLWENSVPPGRYESLRIRFDSIATYAQAARIRPAPPSQGLAIALDLTIAAGDVTPVFLLWNPELDSLGAKTYTPSFKPRQENRVPAASLAIVSNTGSDYLTCIDRFRHRVVAVLPSGRQPMDMVYSAMRQEFYVANSGSDDISVIDIPSGKVERALSLRGGDEPRRIALSTDQERLYVLNGGSQSVSVLNLLSHQEEGRIPLEAAPSALAVDDRIRAVYVISRDSDRLIAVDPGTLSVTSMMSFGANLDELIINRKDRRLYLAKSAQRQVSALDLARNAITGSIRLCGPATGFAFHPISRTLFAAIGDCGQISILKPDDNLELGSIPLPHAPGRVSLDPEAKNLLVTFPAEGKVAFYNANSWKRQSLLDVGKRPFTVAFAQ